MHKFATSLRRLTTAKDQLLGRCRCYSQLAQNQSLAEESRESAVSVPILPAFDYSPPPYTGPTAEEILKKRKEFLSPSMFCFYKKPLNVVHGKMQYLFDENGRRFLDGFGGIATVSCGHCHPDVVQAIIKQTTTLQHSTILYLNHSITDFAAALAAKMPGDLKCLCEYVSLLIISTYEFYLDVVSFNAFSDEVVFRINVLASSVKDWILH
ncbi:alanine--glyoxylate aminotransferase 2 homolog 2, mitochondrial-like protein [Tanacetum coccineum]